MTEHDFLAALGAQLRADLGRDDVEMHSFAERYFAHLEPNDADDRVPAASCATAATGWRC